MPKRFYNCQVHAFTIEHVPNFFVSKTFSVSGILTKKWLRKIIKETPIIGSFGFWGDILVGILSLFSGVNNKKAIRYVTLALIS